MKSNVTNLKLNFIIITLFVLLVKVQAQDDMIMKSHLDKRTKTPVTTFSSDYAVQSAEMKKTNSTIAPIKNNIGTEKRKPTQLRGINLRDTTCPGLQGTVYVGAGAGTPSYPTFNGAGGLFEDINNKALSGDLTVIVQQLNITEPATGTLLNALYYCVGGPYTIYIKPASNSLYTVSGTTVAPAILGFNGATNIVIDGQYNGDGNKWLKFLNTTPGTNDVVLFQNNSNHITIKNCYIEGATGSNAANVYFGISSTTGSGNSFITIDHNNIGSLSFAAGIIASVSSSNPLNHDNNITGNEIFNFQGTFDPINNNNYAAAIYIYGSGNGNNWNISNNSIYNTSTVTTDGQVGIYFLPGPLSNGNIISGNYIGGNAAKRAGTWARSADGFENVGISLNAGTVTLDRDTIENISDAGTTITISSFVCLDVEQSTIATITNSSFGGTGNNSIYILGGGMTSHRCDKIIFGICISGWYYVPLGAPGYIFGIRSNTSGTLTVYNCNISNLLPYGGSDINYYGGYPRPISHTGSGNYVITNNIINGSGGACTLSSWNGADTKYYGIYISNTKLSSAVTGCSISNNQIYCPNYLRNADRSGGTMKLHGIYIEGNYSGIISKNKIVNLMNEVQSTPTIGLHLLHDSLGTWTISNNYISITNYQATINPSGDALKYGFMDETRNGCTINMYYNSIYIGGSNTGSSNSYAYYRMPGGTGTVIGSVIQLYNNILINNRSGSGSHVAIANNGSSNYATGFTSDYNFIASANTNTTCIWGGTNLGFANWKTSSGGDNNSTNASITANNSDASNVNPSELFIDKNTDLHLQLTPPNAPYPLNFVAGSGKPVSILDDYDGNIRSVKLAPNGPTIGIQEILSCKAVNITTQIPNPPPQCAPASTIFSLNTTGDGTISYQWQVDNGSWANITEGGNSPKYTGSSTNSLHVDNDTTALQFRCIASNCLGKSLDTSNVVSITLNAPVTINPSFHNQSKCSTNDSIGFTLNPTSGTGPFSYQWLLGGNPISGATNSLYSKNPISLADSGKYSCIISNACNSQTGDIVSLKVIVCNRTHHKITGYVTYDNNAKTPMSSKTANTATKINLYDNTNKFIDECQTDDNGYYEFVNIVNGTYYVSGTSNKTWRKCQPSDALVVNRYYIGLYKFTDSLKLKTGDLDLNKKVNPTDALMINRRYIGLLNKFKANDYVFEKIKVNISGAELRQDIRAICAADVRGLYSSPPARIMFSPVNNSGLMNISKGMQFNLPVFINEYADLGSFGLKFKVQSSKFKIIGINTDIDELVYNLTDDGINIAWAATETPISINPDKPLLMLNAVYTGKDDPQNLLLSSESCVTDIDVNSISNDAIVIPKLILNNNTSSTFELYNHPNPFNYITYIDYSIPEDANVKLVVYNVLGEEIATLRNTSQKAGNYNTLFDGSNLKQGVYYIRCTMSNVRSTLSKTNIMIIAR